MGNAALAPVKTLITGFWENIGSNYFALNNSAREGAGLTALDKDNIALSYSFTTSEDKKVLSHIANPANWISDQLERQVKVGAAGLRAAAATVFSAQVSGEPSGLDPERFGLPETATDAEVQAAVVAALGKDPESEIVEPSDFLRPGNDDPTSFGFGDTSYYVQMATEGFTPSVALENPDLVPCDDLANKAKFDCVGAGAEMASPMPELHSLPLASKTSTYYQLTTPSQFRQFYPRWSLERVRSTSTRVSSSCRSTSACPTQTRLAQRPRSVPGAGSQMPALPQSSGINLTLRFPKRTRM